MNYTKGTWKAQVTGSASGIIIETDQRRVAVVTLKVESSSWGDTAMFKAQNEECLANAHLIKSAPAMYEALKALYNTDICDICYEDECGGAARCMLGKDGEPCECHERIHKAEELAYKALAAAGGGVKNE